MHAVHLGRAAEVAKLLSIPDDVTQCALLPVAYTRGTDFKLAHRRPLDEVVFWNGYEAGACTPDFDKIQVVKDLRVLAIKADPPEVLVQLPPTSVPTVRLEALVVDPRPDRGADIDWELWVCSAEDPAGCHFAEFERKLHADKTPLDGIAYDFVVDLETIEAALTVAETGHLCFATLHTNSCVQTINRIVDVFPAHQQQQIRTMLSFTLQAIICQQLVPKQHSKGRALAAEVMIANPAIRALIRDNKSHQIMSTIQTGAKVGMKTMNQSLFELYKAGTISYQDAIEHTSDEADFQRLMERNGGANDVANNGMGGRLRR